MVAVVVLNWNGWKDTIECLDSLNEITYPNAALILIDNGSTDGSVQRISAHLEKLSQFDSYTQDRLLATRRLFASLRVESSVVSVGTVGTNRTRPVFLLSNPRNLGYTGGNNIGLLFAVECLEAKYVLLLNNDTVVDGYFVEPLISLAETNQRVGIVGPKILAYSGPSNKNTLESVGGRFNLGAFDISRIGRGEIDRGQHDYTRKVDWLSGNGLLIKSSVLRLVGLLDDQYFMYWEDIDFSLRVREANFEAWCSHNSMVYHKTRLSHPSLPPSRLVKFVRRAPFRESFPGAPVSRSPRACWYYGRNIFLLLRKHASIVERAAFLLMYFGVRLPFTVGSLWFYNRDVVSLKAYLDGVLHGILLLRQSLFRPPI